VLAKEHRVWQNDQTVGAHGGDHGKCTVELVRRRCFHDAEPNPKRLRRSSHLLYRPGVTRVCRIRQNDQAREL
jgi:hypothetical protein